MLSDQPVHLEEAIAKGLFSIDNLERDVISGVNASELANRRFRDIAAISGLIFRGYPGQPIRDRHLQSSSQLIFRVFEEREYLAGIFFQELLALKDVRRGAQRKPW